MKKYQEEVWINCKTINYGSQLLLFSGYTGILKIQTQTL